MGANAKPRVFYNRVKGELEENVCTFSRSRSFSLNAILDAALQKRLSLFRKARLLGSYFSPFKSLALAAHLVAAEM